MGHRFRRPALLVPALLLLLLTAACGAGSAFDEEKPLASCPLAGVLAEADRVVRFQPGSDRSPTDLIFAASIGEIERTCYLEDDEAQIDLALHIEVRRGPANTTAEAPLDYFVVVLDPEDKVVMRQPFKTIVQFKNRDTRAQYWEQFGVLIELGELAPSDYRVYVAFSMTPEELSYNRQRLGR